MNCSNCGTFNNGGFKFCIKCGNSLEPPAPTAAESVATEEFLAEQPVETAQTQSVQPQQSFNTTTVPTVPIDSGPLNYLKYVLGLLLKPFETYKSEEGKLSNAKTSLILSGIVSGAMMLINLIKSMISVVFVKRLYYITLQYKTSFEFSNLKELDYLSLIGKNLLIYVCIIFAIAVVYYLASLVAKKSINFMKTLSISASSLIPYVIMGTLVSPILGKIWTPLSIVATIAGAVYSIIIFVLLIGDNIQFDKKDFSAYFHLVCMTIIGTAGYYAYMKLFTSGITNQISDYLDMFK